MKILYIAFACNPYSGSEAQCGWNWVLHMKDYADVYLLTRKQNKDNIERYLSSSNIKNLNVFYYDVPNIINFYYKTGYFYHLYYYIWLKLSFSYIKKLNDFYSFDYIHHVTLGDFRFMSQAWKLNSKFIFGPVGGAQLTPSAFKKYILRDILKEKLRELLNNFLFVSPVYKMGINSSEYVFCANKETKDLIDMVSKSKNTVLLTENGVNLDSIMNKEWSFKKKITILWAGRIVNRKGLDFLLDIIPMINATKEFEFIIVGDGKEKNRLIKKAKKNNIQNLIKFIGKVPYDQMIDLYNKSDIFVFPSFRETTGTVIFEAMSKGLPVITFNQNGASLIIDNNTGIKINTHQDINNIKEEFAQAIEKLINDDNLRRKYGTNAIRLMKDKYTWEEKIKSFYHTYVGGKK